MDSFILNIPQDQKRLFGKSVLIQVRFTTETTEERRTH